MDYIFKFYDCLIPKIVGIKQFLFCNYFDISKVESYLKKNYIEGFIDSMVKEILDSVEYEKSSK